MKLSQLRNLTAVAKAGSVRQASRDLHISQSAVTKSIKQLEEFLGVELLHRASHGVTPTVFGEALIARASVIEAELRHARNEIEHLEGSKTGDIRISASPTVAMNLVPRAIVSFKKTHPQVNFQIQEGFYPDNLAAVRLGELDAAVCLLPDKPTDEELEFEVLLEDQVTPAVRTGHPLTREANLSLGDLVDRDWIVFGSLATRRQVYEQTFLVNGFEPPKGTVECSSFACALALVEHSDYIALVPKQTFSGRRKGIPIAPLSLKIPMQPWTVAVITRAHGALSPACREFINELRRVAPSAHPGSP
ncbi:MAG: LysR family transcriptional regulator [Rhodospirillales bacterium]|nr:LysR family transcriptional regulator [Rhodospirillales bacterium]